MFYHLFVPLARYWIGFNVFRYITFRATFAAVTAFVISLVFGPGLIRWLESRKFGEKIRTGDDYRDIAERHRHKAGTPTMGGLIILLALLVPTLLWERWDNPFTWMAFGAAAWMGAIGFVDDWMKLRGKGKGRGMSGRIKLAGQVLLALAICFFLYSDPETRDWAQQLRIPFYKHPVVLSMGLVWILFTIVVIAGSSNAVNLTDGLDGLAIGCIGIAAFASAVMAYLTGHRGIADYLNILYIPAAGELTVFCAALIGASLGFLWFNAYPAQVFMGDTGSLACGAAIGTVAVLLKKELFLLLIGGVFVIEALSVLLQKSYFKYSRRRWGEGRRILRCAPLHHHFEKSGWAENKITVRFWICAIIFALLAVGALKLQ